MKRNLSVFLCLLLLLLCACGKSEPTAESTTESVTEAVTETTKETITETTAEPIAPNGPWTMFETAFLPIARGEVGLSLEEVDAFLTEQGYEMYEGEGVIYAYDPEHPGSYLGGELTSIHGIGEVAVLSYHYVMEQGETAMDEVQRAVKVKFMEGPRRYYIALDWLGEGTEVSTVQEMADYIINAQ